MINLIEKAESRFLGPMQSAWDARAQKKLMRDLTFSTASEGFSGRNELYAYMHHHFHNLCPSEVREHRAYYKQERRGFGEDAFHAMWFTLLREFQPRQCLEIGVYRGQVISLWALIARSSGFPCEAHGISPFTSIGDEVSVYLHDVAYLEDTLSNHRHFGLHEPHLTRAFSTDPIALQHVRSRRWDLTYIDGNHDYKVALADYQVCRDNLADGGLLVMDDSSLCTDFRPPQYASAGHSGPSQIVQDSAMKELHFLGGVGHNNVFINK
jgi:cephalosporin hydroxylase